MKVPILHGQVLPGVNKSVAPHVIGLQSSFDIGASYSLEDDIFGMSSPTDPDILGSAVSF